MRFQIHKQAYNCEKARRPFGEEGECGYAEVELLARERRLLDILSVKEEASLSTTALAEMKEGREVKRNYCVIVCSLLDRPTLEIVTR